MTNYYNKIKTELINNEIYKKVKDYSKNRSDLNTYYNVGKLLSEAGKHYGEGIIKKYSLKLTEELGTKYNERTLRRFRQFFNAFNEKNWSAMLTNLTWSHVIELLSLKNIDCINYYINISSTQNLSYRELHNRIKSKEYERLDDKTKSKLIKKENTNVSDFIKNPIVIRNKNKIDINKVSEKILKKLILEDIESFMKELGSGFCFIGSEYKIKIGNTYNYIDLLLYNIEYNCYVVAELKVRELRKEYIGQIEIYMNYVDHNIRKLNQDKTIGIIICKEANTYVIKYCSDKRIISRIYKLI